MPINQRSFPHAAGLGTTAAVVASCGGTRAASPPQPPPSGAAHPPINFPTLGRKLSGPLVTPDQPGYDLARRSFNPLFDNRTPAAVAQGRRMPVFGIVTSFTFDTVQAPELTVGVLDFPAGSVPDVPGGWQQWMASMPDELSSTCNIAGGSPSSCTVISCYVGPATGPNPLLTDLIDRIGSQPTARTVAQHNYLDAMRYFAGCSAKSAAECHLRRQWRPWRRP